MLAQLDTVSSSAGKSPTGAGATHFDRPAAEPTATALALAPYHPSWPARYRVEIEVLRVALAPLAPRFEHIGSTAVPGLAAKPIVDILLGLRRPADIEAYAGRLANFGYQLASGIDYEADDRRFLVRTVRAVRTHHVHVVELMAEPWHRLLLFRDMLRIDPSLAREYELLKRRLAAEAGTNRFAYAGGKTLFVQAALGVQA